MLPQLCLRPPPCHDNRTSTCKQASGFQMAILYVSLYLIAMGTGGLKSSVSGFGTDQFDENDEKEKVQMAYFFNRLFFFITLGTLMAVTVLVYIQDEVGRSWAYGICLVSMCIAILIFLSATKRYRYKKRMGSPMVDILQVIVAATRKWKLNVPSDIDLLYEDTPECIRVHRTDQFCFLDKAAVVTKEDYGVNISLASNPWTLCPITKAEEVKMMIKLLPIWATTIIFWTTYAQVITFSVQQASTMKRFIGDFQIPAGSLTVFFVSAILITLALYDWVVMPLWKATRGKPGVGFIYTGQLDFFITQSPRGMKTMSTGLFLTTLSLGSFVSSFLVSVVKKVTRTSDRGGQGWVGDKINNGRLDCFYGLLAGLSFINFGIYLLCAARYNPQTGEQQASEVKSDDGKVSQKLRRSASNRSVYNFTCSILQGVS